MKRIILTSAVLTSVSLYSQCTIKGSDSLEVGQTATYSIEQSNSLRLNAVNWKLAGNKLEIQEKNNNTVTVKSVSVGEDYLSVEVPAETGIIRCGKVLTILPTGSSTSEQQPPKNLKADCNVKVADFKDIKISHEVISFTPVESADSYRYSWEVSYLNGDKQSSSEVSPKFKLNKSNPIKQIKIKVISKECMKEFTKTYDQYYWMYF